MKDMRVRDLKKIISDLPDDMVVVIPIIGEDDVNKIFGFRKVRTAGILSCSSDINREALCINTAEDGYDGDCNSLEREEDGILLQSEDQLYARIWNHDF